MPQYYTLVAATESKDAHATEDHAATDEEHHEATTSTAEHGSETGAAVLGIDPLAIALQAGTFLILFIIFQKFALAKVVQTLEDRRQTIDEGLKNAEDIEQQKEALVAENESVLKAARQEADDIISKSHEEAGAIVAEAQERASKQADDIVSKAKSQAQAEVTKARAELKSEMLDLVAEATETVLGEKLTDAADKKLIEKALKQGANS